MDYLLFQQFDDDGVSQAKDATSDDDYQVPFERGASAKEMSSSTNLKKTAAATKSPPPSNKSFTNLLLV